MLKSPTLGYSANIPIVRQVKNPVTTLTKVSHQGGRRIGGEGRKRSG